MIPLVYEMQTHHRDLLAPAIADYVHANCESGLDVLATGTGGHD